MIQLYADSVYFDALGDVILTGDRTGFELTFQVKAVLINDATIDLSPQVKVEMKYTDAVYSGEPAFEGLVQDLRYDEQQGVYICTCWDYKRWLYDWPYFGRSLQSGLDERNNKVKYGYSEATDASDRLKRWTVGLIVQDIIHNGLKQFSGQNLPLVTDLLPLTAGQIAAWKDDYENWEEIGDVYTTWTPTGPWQDLDRVPFGHQFDAMSIGSVIDDIVNKYYPAYGWWIDPTDSELKPAPYEMYDTDGIVTPLEYDCEDAVTRPWLNSISPVLDNCFTRVIIEGGHSAETAIGSGSHVTGFVNSDYPYTPGQTVSVSYYWGDGTGTATSAPLPGDFGLVWISMTTTDKSSIDTEGYKLQSQATTTKQFAYYGNALPSPASFAYTTKAGLYGKDTRWRIDIPRDTSGWAGDDYGGDAYDEYGIARIMTMVDDTLGDAVWDGQDLVDRSELGQEIAEEIWAMLSGVRWTGILNVIDTPLFNPLQGIKVTNHPVTRYVDIEFVPVRVEWNASTRQRIYTLGDNKKNPVSEMMIRKQLNFRDREEQRKREPMNLK